MNVYLLHRPPLCGGALTAVYLRAPDDGALARIDAAMGADGRLPVASVPALAAKLSIVTAAVLAKLSAPDMERLRKALEALHRQATASSSRRHRGGR